MVTSNSSKAAIANIACTRADTFKRILRFWEDKQHTIPIDITDMEFSMKVSGGNRSQVILSLTMEAGLTISGDNELTILQTPAQMTLPANTYRYDLQAIEGGETHTIVKGYFTINDDIT